MNPKQLFLITTDFVYLRFIGDKSIQEKDFGRIQIDRIVEMQKWANNIKNTQNDERVKLSIVAANNHYAGLVLALLTYLETC
jgi:hypothetical protein